MISIIVAIAEKNNAIGYQNRLLWKLPEDMKRFKTITTGHTVIMGRNTFLSLPKGVLPNRRNVVISDIADEHFEGCIMAKSIDEAIEITKNDGEVFIMGGASIYRQFFPHASKLYLTLVDDAPVADTFFPEIDFEQWNVLEEVPFIADEKHLHNFKFVTLQKK
ncbi:MAG: dihydrofolate reductase [Bacteroidales bacterium]|jgi:dihydrofolate reductase|nr:dihydrofolate reductase [Bacteroidales bacterium]MDD2204222.1 dihydrofolate reductase [Bacteroidales bacterium]MDD3152377.1 dihydrofolate reductase [Bacteroidales bacterium]MDD3913605.1 dihydrofolate reductase [Bacteroidales bacterium]MDD4633627.1 dihydrofolate reductase [Bacteroidales bacterium]